MLTSAKLKSTTPQDLHNFLGKWTVEEYSKKQNKQKKANKKWLFIGYSVSISNISYIKKRMFSTSM